MGFVPGGGAAGHELVADFQKLPIENLVRVIKVPHVNILLDGLAESGSVPVWCFGAAQGATHHLMLSAGVVALRWDGGAAAWLVESIYELRRYQRLELGVHLRPPLDTRGVVLDATDVLLILAAAQYPRPHQLLPKVVLLLLQEGSGHLEALGVDGGICEAVEGVVGGTLPAGCHHVPIPRELAPLNRIFQGLIQLIDLLDLQIRRMVHQFLGSPAGICCRRPF